MPKEPKSNSVENLVFHPIKISRNDSWYPGNEAARLNIQIHHIWDDIAELCRIHGEQRDDYARTLIMKYAVIETVSLMDVIDKIQAIVFKSPVSNSLNQVRSLTESEKISALEYFKNYNSTKNNNMRFLSSARNDFCAHRTNKDWNKIKTHWDSLNPKLLNPILKVIMDTVLFCDNLDIYEWNRTYDDGGIEFFGPRTDFSQLFNEHS